MLNPFPATKQIAWCSGTRLFTPQQARFASRPNTDSYQAFVVFLCPYRQ